MEPTQVKMMIPIDSWGFDQDYVWVMVQGVRLKVSFPNRYLQMKTPTLSLEINLYADTRPAPK